jgi:hypothetical protein
MWQFSYMFSLIPDSFFVWITYILVGLGLALYVASKLVSIIPFIKQYKLPAEIIGIVLLVTGAYMYGGYGTEKMWRERVKDAEDKIKIAEQQAVEANSKIQTKIVERVKEIKVFQDRIKEVIVEKEKIIDAQCKVAPEAIDILNTAAKGAKTGNNK